MSRRLLSNYIRKSKFFHYYLHPLRFSMLCHQMSSRVKSRLNISQGLRIIDLAVSYECNLACKHCSAALLKSAKDSLTLSDYNNIVAQADALDNLAYNITGGEPLLVEWLDDLIPILNPKKHYINVQTNCMLLTEKRAKQLSRLGVNCITTSLDSIDEGDHNEFRGSSDAYRKVFEGVDNALKAGMNILVAGTVTHQNIHSPKLRKLIEQVNKLGAVFLFNIGVPCGNWKDNYDVVFKEDDRKYLLRLMDEYPWTSTDHEVNRNAIGCPAGKEKIYITAYGDVIPCTFIHVSFGNVRDSSLIDIINRMRKVREYREYFNVCIAAEDTDFHTSVFKKIQASTSKEYPIMHKEIYGEL